MNKKLWCSVILGFTIMISSAQIEPNPFSFEYTMAPEGDDEIEFYRTLVNVAIPIKLKKGMLMNAVGFNYFQLNHNGANFSTTDLSKIYGLNYTLMYMRPLSEKWSFMLRAGTAMVSNLTASVQSDDFLFNAGLSFRKTGGSPESPYQFTFGVGYVPVFGEPRILPIINYTKKFNKKYTLSIGFPNTYLAYNMSEKSVLKTALWLNSFYANLSEDVIIPGTRRAEKSVFISAGLGLEYNYSMDKNWAIFVKGGYSFYNEYELLDADNNTLYDFEATAKPYFSTGIQLNIKSKNKKRNDDQQK